MRLRLPEQPQQRKQQSMAHQTGDATFCRAKLYDTGDATHSFKKISEKALTFTREIRYQCDWLQERIRNFCPVGFFVCSKPNDQKTKTNTTGKEKEQIPCIQ